MIDRVGFTEDGCQVFIASRFEVGGGKMAEAVTTMNVTEAKKIHAALGEAIAGAEKRRGEVRGELYG